MKAATLRYHGRRFPPESSRDLMDGAGVVTSVAMAVAVLSRCVMRFLIYPFEQAAHDGRWEEVPLVLSCVRAPL